MSRVPLSDDETRVIFSGESVSNLESLDAGQQEQVIRRLIDVVDSQSPPSAFVREQIANLDIIAAGDQCRLYTKVSESLPRGNAEYHAIFVFYIDESHDYNRSDLMTYHKEAQSIVESMANLETIGDVEEVFERNDALDVEDLRDLLP